MAAAVTSRRPYWGSKIVALGKNYAKHKVEMGGTAERLETPMFFIKPNSSVIGPGESIVRPKVTKDLHHELELGVVIRGRCKHVAAADWKDVVAGYVLGLDMTARDLQADAKAKGFPWTLSKCMDTFTPLSGLVDVSEIPDPHDIELFLEIDGVTKQRGSTAAMLHKIPEIIEYVSSVMTLEDGDVILTGTPEGVGPVLPGQTIRCGITGLVDLSFPVIEEADLRP